jgi:glycosyltransferase involved in cell wall biosynthesis
VSVETAQMAVDVSVIIPAHNRSRMLVDAIDSCRRSAPSLVLEVIVVDDASDDDLAQTVSGMDVVFEQLAVNSGSSTARNRGFMRATGRYVKFLDSDDVLVEGSLQREFETALRTDADIVVAGWTDTRLDEAGCEEVLHTFAAPSFTCVPDDLLAGRAVPTSAALYKRTIAAQVAWDPLLAKLNDWDYFIMAALQSTTIVSVDGPAYLWRQHAGVRITSSATFVSNAMEFYIVLGKLGAALENRGKFTASRRRRMAQYLFKELRGLYRFNCAARYEVLTRILELDPRFRARDEERSRVLRYLFAVLPAHWVLASYGLARRLLDRLSSSHAGRAAA